MAVEVEIIGVAPCDCPTHAKVVLRDAGRARKLQVRVHADAGQALLAEIAGVASSRSAMIDLMCDALEAGGGTLESLTIGYRGGQLCARLCLRLEAGSRDVDAEPCEGLIAACRLKLRVFVDEDEPVEAQGEVPDIFRDFVASLDMSGLDRSP